jgi:spore coat protein A, manganese oxidase
MQGGHPVHLHLSQFQVLNRETLTTQALSSYMSDWEKAFGKNKLVPLPATCKDGTYCPDYGPPLDYKTINKDHALGGNLPFSDYTNPR